VFARRRLRLPCFRGKGGGSRFPNLCDGHGNKVVDGYLGGRVTGDAEEGEGGGGTRGRGEALI